MTERKRYSHLRVAALAIAAAAFVAPVLAAEVTTDEVQSAVETWVRHVTAEARSDAVVARLEPYVVDGQTLAYIAHLRDGGFCLCGADNRLIPVYLYAPRSEYDPDHPGQHYILDEIATRLSAWNVAEQRNDPALRLHATELAERAAYWQALVDGNPPHGYGGDRSRSDPEMMVLPVTCQWDQGSPYNDQCPNLTPGEDERVLVGCVATAMAQVMYYWQWPETGEGSGTTEYTYFWRDDWDGEPLVDDPNIPAWWNDRLIWTPFDGGTLWMTGYWDLSVFVKALAITDDPAYESALRELDQRATWEHDDYDADFSASTYDWSLMADVHQDPPDAGDTQAAQLSYDAAVSVNMFFGIHSSSAHTQDFVPPALTDHFRYDPDVIYNAVDTNYMTAEIQWLRPIIFRAGNATGGGHAWVVYGYNTATDPQRQFMMNFGWGGGGDGWYSCDLINPPDWLFSENQGFVKWIAPESVVRFVGSDAVGDGTPASPYRDIAEAVANAPDQATLIFKAGSMNTFSAGLLTVDRPMTLKGYDVTIAVAQ